jgi:hypothetical protein
MTIHSLGSNPFRFFDSVTDRRNRLVVVPELNLPYESAVEVGPSDELLVYGHALAQLEPEQRRVTIQRLSDDRWIWFRARLAQVATAANLEAARREHDWAAAEIAIPQERLPHERLRDANASYWLARQCRWVEAICRRLLIFLPKTTPEWAIGENEFGLEMPHAEKVRLALGDCPMPPNLELGEKRPEVPEVVSGSHLAVCGPVWYRLAIGGRPDDVIVINARGRCVSPVEDRQVRWLRQIGFAV